MTTSPDKANSRLQTKASQRENVIIMSENSQAISKGNLMPLAGSTSVNVSHHQALKEWNLTFSTQKESNQEIRNCCEHSTMLLQSQYSGGGGSEVCGQAGYMVKPLKTNQQTDKQTKPHKLSPHHDYL